MKQALKHILTVYRLKQLRQKQVLIEKSKGKTCDIISDSRLFTGISGDGFSFFTRQTKSTTQQYESFLAIHIPGKGNWIFENSASEQQNKSQLNCNYIHEGEEWQIDFDGIAYQDKEEKALKLNLRWKPATPRWDTDQCGTTDLELAKKILEQNIHKKNIEKLPFLNLVNIIQSGKIAGQIELSDKNYKVDFLGIRKQTCGLSSLKEFINHFCISGLMEDGRFLHISEIDFESFKDYSTAFVVDQDKSQIFTKIMHEPKLGKKLLFQEPLNLELRVQNQSKTQNLQLKPLSVFTYRVAKNYLIHFAEISLVWEKTKGIGYVEIGSRLSL